MRLWHYKLLPFLPKSQLLAQWRELNSIFKNQPKHILINYIYEYSKYDLYIYANLVITEMENRGYRIKSIENYKRYFGEEDFVYIDDPFPDHHDDEYLAICYFNLLEKYQRGQKDFSGEEMQALAEYCEPYIKRYMSDD